MGQMKSLSVSRLVHGYMSQSVGWLVGRVVQKCISSGMVHHQAAGRSVGMWISRWTSCWVTGFVGWFVVQLVDWLGTQHFVSISVMYVTQLQKNNFRENYVNHFQVAHITIHSL
jgi:hypothetical protein